MRGLRIRTDRSAAELRALACHDGRPRAAARLHAIALDGSSRTEAARLCGINRQALRDAVVRDDAGGVDDWPTVRPPALSRG